MSEWSGREDDGVRTVVAARHPLVHCCPGGPEQAEAREASQAVALRPESDAENLKARLALSGWEASVQAATLPDKSVRYRVRLGPYDNTDELNRIKAELGKGGFDVAVIRNP